MSKIAVDPKVQHLAAKSNSFAADLLQLHRPVAGGFGYLVCAESCRVGNQGAGDVQTWPCSTAEMALAHINETHSALKHEDHLNEQTKSA